MMTGIEHWESHECNKPGQLCKDGSVRKKRIAERGNKPKGKSWNNSSSARSDGRNVGV